METITTKQLREHMSQIIRALRSGRSIQLTYRHKVIGSLQPVPDGGMALRRGSPQAVLQFLEQRPFKLAPGQLRETTKSFKEEIAELRDKDLADT